MKRRWQACFLTLALALGLGCGCAPAGSGSPSDSATHRAAVQPPVTDHPLPPASEDTLRRCWVDSDCIVVPFRHCCGSTRTAIHRGYLEAYRAHPEWQVFEEPGECSVMGMCPSDEHITEARCRMEQHAPGAPGRCVLAD